MKKFMIKLKNFIPDTNGQAMTEYVLTVAFITLITIPAIKLIPKAFEAAFKRIITFHSLHLDDLARKISNVFF